jgi:ubiquinone/menaquinone biosynthesis C-methylase UbiE
MTTTGNDDTQSLSQQRFGAFAQRYVTSQGHAQGADLDRLVAIAAPQPDWVVLDVATGGGHTALRFAPHVRHVVATDLTRQMLEAAQTHIAAQGIANVSYELADAADLPFDDGQFDAVTCRIAPHHFAEPTRFVREATRVLVPGGLLLVQDHVLPDDEEIARYIDAFERLRDPSHVRAYSEGEWATIYQVAGLQVEQVEQVTKRHAFLSWAERQDCSPETVERLIEMMARAPAGVVTWMEPRDWRTPKATFGNRHILLAGRKGRP